MCFPTIICTLGAMIEGYTIVLFIQAKIKIQRYMKENEKGVV